MSKEQQVETPFSLTGHAIGKQQGSRKDSEVPAAAIRDMLQESSSITPLPKAENDART